MVWFPPMLREENLNYNSCTNLLLRKSQNLLFVAPEVQWALKTYRVCSIHVFFKCFEPRPYLGLTGTGYPVHHPPPKLNLRTQVKCVYKALGFNKGNVKRIQLLVNLMRITRSVNGQQ